MNFSFRVGSEGNRVDFSFNPMWGNLTITVDGIPRTRDIRMFSLRLVKRYQLLVGEVERHDVVIEKERKLLFAGFRKQTYRAFVDGHLVFQEEGY